MTFWRYIIYSFCVFHLLATISYGLELEGTKEVVVYIGTKADYTEKKDTAAPLGSSLKVKACRVQYP